MCCEKPLLVNLNYWPQWLSSVNCVC